jgi:Xaa-Pro aminopeptidase
MDDEFSAEFFAANRARLREALGDVQAAVFTGNGLVQRNGDTTFKFRQDSSFWYLTGITEPDITLVMDGDEEFLILPGRDIVREAFDGVVSAEMLSARSGIGHVLGEDEGWKRLHHVAGKARHLATFEAAPLYIERHGFYRNPARARLIEHVTSHDKKIEVIDAREHAVRLRMIKQPVEVAAIRQAIDVTIASLEAITSAERLKAYRHEYEIEADLTREFRRRGCGHAFEPIVASGPRACQLHYIANNGAVDADGLLILDVGAEHGLYAADISRTVAIGTPSDRQRQVHESVLAVQDFALTLLKPGTMLTEYEKQVEQRLGEELRKLGVIKDDSRESIRKYYPHAASHFMGLDVHDVGDYQEPLAEGMVLTCEPGIYIPEEAIGVRIEDDVIISADGHEVLTAASPRLLYSE